MIEDTIVAIATPNGKAGVAIVRISGEKSHEIIKGITKTKNNFNARHMYLKDIYLDEIVDNALVVFFASPNSYTGEDVAEIQCHGGFYIAEEVLKKCLELGARLAQPGEFSKRAFLNGKLTVDQAEGIMDIINAETKTQAKAGSELINGELFKLINNIQLKLLDVIASIEAKLDYPEYDFEQNEIEDTSNSLLDCRDKLSSLLDTRFKGILIKNGVKVAIVGKPNVGKSSLLNALTNSNKAIVTNIAGTTRDVIEGEYIFNGIIFRLFDTAGIHESDDVVEKIGIERAIDTIKNADIVLKLLEPNEKFDVKTYDKPIITVYTKADLQKNEIDCSENEISISSVTNKNVDKLKQMIFDMTLVGGYDNNQLYLTNVRHIENIKVALEAINRAIEGLEFNSLDIVVADIKQSWTKLGEITGQTSNEDIINRIFEKFCLGK